MRPSPASWWRPAVRNRLIGLVLAIVVLVPLVAIPAEHLLPGLTALTLDGLAVLLFATLLWRARGSARRENIAAFLRTGANTPVLLFLGVVLLSCIFSPRTVISASVALRTCACILLYFVVAYQFRHSEQLLVLVDALVLVTAAASLIGFVQFGATQEHYATGPFGDHQLLGSFLMVLLPVVVTVAVAERSPNRRLAAQVTAVLAAACLLLAQARSAWVGAAAGLIALGVLAGAVGSHGTRSKSRRQGGARRYEVVLPVLLLLVSIGVFLALSPQTSAVTSRMATLTDVRRDANWQSRQPAWLAAIRMFREHPWRGVGLGLFPYNLERYSTVAAPIAAMGMRASMGEQAHNFALQTLAELGIPGLILMVATVAAFFVTGLRHAWRTEPGLRRNLLLATMGSTVAFVIDGLASPSWQFSGILLFFWLILGLGVGCVRPAAIPQGEAGGAPAPCRVLRPMAVLSVIVLGALVPMTVLADGGADYRVPISVPVSVSLEPRNATIARGALQKYRLSVTFRNLGSGIRETFDGSLSPHVTFVAFATFAAFSQTGGAGILCGPNHRIYAAGTRAEEVRIAGTYVQGNVRFTDSTVLHVRP